jgi:hypothetical protein
MPAHSAARQLGPATPNLSPATPAQQAARDAHDEGCRLRALADGHADQARRLHALADAAFRRAVAALSDADR